MFGAAQSIVTVPGNLALDLRAGLGRSCVLDGGIRLLEQGLRPRRITGPERVDRVLTRFDRSLAFVRFGVSVILGHPVADRIGHEPTSMPGSISLRHRVGYASLPCFHPVERSA